MSANIPASRVVTVRTMAGSKQTPLALRCLGSLRQFVRHPVEFAVHSDGTLTDDDKAKLVERLGDCLFIEKGDTQAVDDALANYPHCREFRRSNLFAVKLLDIPLMSSERVIYCDTDVLFTRPVRCAAFFEGDGAPFVGMRDLAEQYSVRIRDWQALTARGVRLSSRLCAGFLAFSRQAYDLDYIEWLLSLDGGTEFFSAFPFWAEQTLYAALAGRAGCAWVDPRECVIAHPLGIRRRPIPAIIHFAGFHRHYIDTIEPLLDPEDARPPLELGTRPTPICTLPLRLLSAVRKRIYL